MNKKKDKKKIYIKTWGCQMNEHDSSIIKNILSKEKKYTFVSQPEISDILILNTCSIREKAQEKLFHQLGRWKKLKQKNSNIIIAIGGCVATQEGENIYKRAKFINVIFGTQSLHKLPQLIHQAYSNKNLIIDIKGKSLKKFDYSPLKQTKKKFTSFVTIMEGCNKYCSFCIVPYTRGKEISRNNKEIILEIKKLTEIGVKEIILLGQNVNSYYINNKFNKKKYNFSDLLYSISEIPEINRIRYITSHPMDFSDDIIESYKYIPQLTNFLHLPVQSGSNKILRLMKRGYTVEIYENIINKLKYIRPKISISSDFIIGFPGETQKDFEKTLNFISKINFDTSYSFIYSKRPGTRAAKLADNTSIEEKKNRLYILQKKINQQSFQWRRRMLGTIQEVLVEGIAKNNIQELYGRTENNRIINFEGNPKCIGTFVKLKVIDINYNTYLKGIIK
ncbi:tRNA (N6-isopentenyl adenosine(37)-C2)-methylthiotransferase MiaB [Buchnera aphidicola]|uniref:tRNA-2-methylthio-N(6)-dimethylallyladenosine synthase n=1 Tax=Buchnera aphidicola (Cinara curvipes) TaxID=2518975 RepID=A0A451D728_9GAMM|nr:tRNA (N6-isopentenyl adenosine(37)-C2)-methylthiotransferase MiaB [Buchnera aphidicola]VFP81565.1 tRNA-2-methylthio-N(6)-dimethylallyladenosine synthase [Buchnera aphidicola (Cinara curvipes)]